MIILAGDVAAIAGSAPPNVRREFPRTSLRVEPNRTLGFVLGGFSMFLRVKESWVPAATVL